jgi:hypothetical protein
VVEKKKGTAFFNRAVTNVTKIELAVPDPLGGSIRNSQAINPFEYKWIISN